MKRAMIGLGLVAVAVAVGMWTVRETGNGDKPPAVDPVQGFPPVSYAITYEVSDADGVIAAERLVVDRPFRSRYEAGDVIRITDAGWFAATSNGTDWSRIEVPITLAGGDVRPLAILDPARAEGLIEPAGTDRIAGRPCTRYRLGAPLTSGFVPVTADGRDVTEVCVDADGLVLAERWTIDGVVARDRVATAVALGPVSEDEFAITGAVTDVSVDDFGGATAPADPDADPGFADYWVIDVGAGFDHAGRWAVVPPAVGTVPDSVGLSPRLIEVAMITDAWVKDGELLVLDQGATIDGLAPPWDELGYSQSVVLDDVGEARVVWDARMSEVRVHRSDGGFVRVAGTMSPAEVLAVARTLHNQSAIQPAGVAPGPVASDGPEG